MDLSKDELAFYDALEVNDSAVKVLGDETLRANVKVDWTARETAHLRVLVRRLLRKHGYSLDKQGKATLAVIEQAEMLARD